MIDLLNLIKCCSDLEELNFFVLSEIWRQSPRIRKAILSRYKQLDPQQTQYFGTPDFWKKDATDSYEDDDMVPDGYEVIDEWHEGKYMGNAKTLE